MTHNEAAEVLVQELRYLGGGPMPDMSEYDAALHLAVAALREREPLLEDLKRTFLDDPCIACLHGQPPAPCDDSDFTCEVCTKPCACKTCADFDRWVWRGTRGGAG